MLLLKKEILMETTEELLGYAQREYYSDFPCDDTIYDIVDLQISLSSIDFERNGLVEYVDIIGELSDGRYINLSKKVEWVTENPGIADYNRGCITALDSGSTVITVSYMRYNQDININVENFISFDMYFNEVFEKSVPGTHYNKVMGRAYAMMEVEWVPTQDFKLNDGTTARAGTVLQGIPYSQLNHVKTPEEFLIEVQKGINNANGFYDTYYTGKFYWSKFGVDCSGLLCNSYNIPKHNTESIYIELTKANSSKFEKVGTYTATGTVSTGVNKASLKTAYDYLTPTCGIVTRGSTSGHTRLVLTTYDDKVVCIEAANNFPETKIYSCEQLATDRYCPFTIKTSYFNQYN